MTRIIVGSANPVKVQSVHRAFQAALSGPFDVQGLHVPSGVSKQPLTDTSTLQGAVNRAKRAREQQPGADFWVGIEGGVERYNGAFEAFGWVYILHPERSSSARSATFPLPASLQQRLAEGEELGPLIDELFGVHNVKQRGGAVGMLSRELVSREALYRQPLILALIPFMQPELF